jgi:predicted helicase
VRANPKISGTKYNVFGIQTGVAIVFLVKKADQQGSAKIFYSTLQDEQTRKEKLDWFNSTRFKDIAFESIRPDKKSNWLDLTDNDFDELIPLIDKQAKSGLSEKAIFKLFSRGVETTRDEWVYDINESALLKKMGFFVDRYNSSISNGKKDLAVKWCSSLEASFQNAQKAKFNDKIIRRCLFRPYYKPFYYSDKLFSHRLTQNHFDFLGPSLQSPNLVIAFNGLGMDKPFSIVACDGLVDIQIMPNGQTTALYRYDENERQIDNITDWGLKQFQENYKNKKITKEDIFYYVYAVLHSPKYRKKYEINLKREFPRIPFYDDFKNWRNWGKTLMDIHINFETAAPLNLKRVETTPPKQKRPKLLDVTSTNQLPESERAEHSPKPRLKADKEHGSIELDDQTTLTGIPKEAWEYKLGNRSALEWVLDQYKEYKPSDPTIAEKFNTYRFADYKEKVIDLLKRVCTVSVKTMEIIRQMK